MKIALSIIIMLTAYSCALALEYNLDEAFDRALTVDKAYKSARVNTEEAYTAVGAAKGVFFPRASLDASVQKTYGIEPTVIEIPNMGTLDMGVTGDEQMQVGLTLTQPIYLAGMEYAGLRMSRDNYALGLEQERDAKEDVLYNTAVLYYSVLLLQETLEAAEESYNVANSHLESTQERFNAGLVSEFDVLSAQVQVTNLYNANNQIKDSLKSVERMFRITLQLPENEVLVLTDPIEPDFEGFVLQESLDIARANRSDIKQLDLGIKLADANISMEYSATRPTVTLGANLSEMTSSLDIGGEDWGDSWDDTYTIMLNVSWPFFDSFITPTKAKMARYQKEELEISRSMLEDGIAIEIEGLYDTLITAEETVETNDKNIELATRAYDIAEARYNAGLMSTLDVLDSQNYRNQAKLNYYNSINSYIVAKLDMLKAMGVLLEYYDK